jgi:hypothetical protein
MDYGLNMIGQAYRARRPKASPLWQYLSKHFEGFLDVYEERYQSRYGYLRPVIPEVVKKFLDCGNLERGFARVRCDPWLEDDPFPNGDEEPVIMVS